MRAYYWRWLKTAFTHSIGVVDLWTGLITAALSIVDHYLPGLQLMTSYGWQIPVWALTAVMAVRLLLAPYWIWKEDQQKKSHDSADAARIQTVLRRQVEAVERDRNISQKRLEERINVVAGIEKLIDRGSNLKREEIPNEDRYSHWEDRRAKWTDDVTQFLSSHVSHTAALRFQEHRLIIVSQFAGSYSAPHAGSVCRLDDQINSLKSHLAWAKDQLSFY